MPVNKGATKVELTLKAHRLKNVAGVFKGISDPYAEVTIMSPSREIQPVKLGRTEVVKNNLSPDWFTAFEFDFHFAVDMKISVAVYDEVRKSKRDIFMGSAVFDVGEILGSRGNTKRKKLNKGGILFATIQTKQKRDLGELVLKLRGEKIKNVDGIFGKSDPFFEIWKTFESPSSKESWAIVHRSEHIDNSASPEWREIRLSLNRLSGGDLDKPIKIKVFDWDKKGKYTFIGECLSNCRQILQGNPVFTIKDKKGKDAGRLIVESSSLLGGSKSVNQNPSDVVKKSQAENSPSSSKIEIPLASLSLGDNSERLENVRTSSSSSLDDKPNFVDYLSGGCEISMCVAIDLTSSNGNPFDRSSLHYLSPDGNYNSYEKAIAAIGEIVARYDSDQKFPVWGFGAKVNGTVQHCFQCGSEKEVEGVSGILHAYKSVFQTGLVMSGPTVFTEVIKFAAKKASMWNEEASLSGKQNYTILLLLTNGSLSDVDATKKCLSEVDDPLSTIIVGLGDGDFSALEYLDEHRENWKGRDTCTFVQFNKHNNRRSLTEATLSQIPDQLVDFYFSRGIKPNERMLQASFMMEESVNSQEGESELPEEIDLDLENDLSLVYYDGLSYATGAPLVPVPPPTFSNSSTGAYQPINVPPSSTSAYKPMANTASPEHLSLPPLPPPGQSYSSPQLAPPYSQVIPEAVPVAPGFASSQCSPYPPVIATASAVEVKIFQVRIPQGAVVGTTLRIKNPYNGRDMDMVVPPGVSGGDLVAVESSD